MNDENETMLPEATAMRISARFPVSISFTTMFPVIVTPCAGVELAPVLE